MNGNASDTSMSGRFAAGILVTFCLLLPTSVAAQDPAAVDSPAATSARVANQPSITKFRRLPPTTSLPKALLLDEWQMAAAPLVAAGPAYDGVLKASLTVNTPEPSARRPQSSPGDSENQPRSVTRELERFQQRLEELEIARIAHEDATRTIIDQSFSRRGSHINDIVVFGGTHEVLTGWAQDFDGVSESDIVLDTTEFDFEIQANDWILGSLVLEYIDGSDFLFPTTERDEVAVDRMNVDTAYVTIGNTQQFWLFGTFGRAIAPFGISTGDPVANVLTLDDPLTIEVFETKEDMIWLGFEFPTPLPPLPPPAVPIPTAIPPKVRPLLIAPFISKLSRRLGYRPPPPGPPLGLTSATPTPNPPPFSGGIYFYNGDTDDGGADNIDHFGMTLGYQTRGVLGPHCLPWTLDIDVDFNSSVFDSRFLEFQYRSFLDEIGYVPGMAAHAKSSLGPVSFVMEWNGAINKATFTDDLGNAINIAPGAWQVTLGYQFDWNPMVEAIGMQGTYFTISYSDSYDLAGVTRVIDMEQMRVGFVPKRRFIVGLGEWVFDTTRVAIEYAHIVDYSVAEGGTGNSGDGVFGMLTYEW